MASSVESKVIDITTCPICLEKLTKPKYLPCLHTFCESCIMTYISSGVEKENNQSIDCPVCRTPVPATIVNCSAEEWAKALPVNFLIVGLLETEKFQRPNRICMLCERIDIITDASSLCVQCSDLLCSNCSKYHKASKTSSDHEIKPLLELSDITSVKTYKNNCLEHKNKEIELYCVDHEDPCCSMCVSILHRKCEKVLSIEDAAKGFKSSDTVDDFRKQLSQVEENINAVLSDRRTCLEDLENLYKNTSKNIEQVFDDLITEITNMKATRQAELDKVYNEAKETVDTTLTLFDRKQKILDNEKQIFETCANKASEVQLMIELKKLKQQLNQHKEVLRSKSGDMFRYKLYLKIDGELSKITQLLKKDCQISCDKKPCFIAGKTSDVHSFTRFETTSTGWNVNGKTDSVSFKVSNDIIICGFLSYACQDGASTCQVSASIIDGTTEIVKVLCHLDSGMAENGLLKIQFPEPVRTVPNKKYEAVVVMKGPPCNYGNNGKETVDCNGVIFTFEKSSFDNNGTGATNGQIPGLLFTKL